jgi:hypothetical protein
MSVIAYGSGAGETGIRWTNRNRCSLTTVSRARRADRRGHLLLRHVPS